MKFERFLSTGLLIAALGVPSLTTFTTWAKGGDSGGGGGDLLQITRSSVRILKPDELSGFRLERLKKYIAHDLSTDLVTHLKKRLKADEADAAIEGLPKGYEAILAVLSGKGRERFLDDIRKPNYTFSESPVYAWCGDQDGKEKDAATCGHPSSEVRFNYRKIARYDLRWPEMQRALMQLAFHEHVRHFGFDDKDHVLARMAGFAVDRKVRNEKLLKYLREGTPHPMGSTASKALTRRESELLLEYQRVKFLMSSGIDGSETYFLDRGHGADWNDGGTILVIELNSLAREYKKQGFGELDALKLWEMWGRIRFLRGTGDHFRMVMAVYYARRPQLDPGSMVSDVARLINLVGERTGDYGPLFKRYNFAK